MAKRKKPEAAGAAVAEPRDTHTESLERRDEPEFSVERSDAMEAAIAARAYEIYQERGGADGRALDDWLQAEAELSQRHVRHGEPPLVSEED